MIMQELEVVKFIKNNEDNWKELLSGDPYYINIKEDDNYILLKYSQIDSDFNEQICRECRGLILSKNEDYKPVRLAFYKFFNHGEPFADRIHWKSCKTRMKVDGSMMSVWYDRGKWHLSTSGAIDAWKTLVDGHENLTFGDVFEKALKNNGFTWDGLCCYLDEDYCYTFELVSPETRVVIPYKKADLYLIGCRCMLNLEEIEIEDVSIAERCLVKTPIIYPLNNIKACIQSAEHLGYNEEGYVVVDKYYHRVKIKSPAYVAAHHVSTNGAVTESKVFDIVERGEKDEFLTYFPEYKEIFEQVEYKKNDFKIELKQLLNDYNALKEDDIQFYGKVDKAKYAKALQQSEDEFEKKCTPFIYKLLDSDLIDIFIDWQWSKLSREKKLAYLDIKKDQEKDGD